MTDDAGRNDESPRINCLQFFTAAFHEPLSTLERFTSSLADGKHARFAFTYLILLIYRYSRSWGSPSKAKPHQHFEAESVHGQTNES